LLNFANAFTDGGSRQTGRQGHSGNPAPPIERASQAAQWRFSFSFIMDLSL
jgi:hypothetical protein